MNDIRRERMANIAVDETDLTATTGKQVTITFETALPFVTIDDDYIKNTEFMSEDYTPKSDKDIFNTLVDPTFYINKNSSGKPIYEDRFIFLTEINTSIPKSRSRLYYDKKYNDIIIVPGLETLGKTDVTNGMYMLNGYVVGESGYLDSINDPIKNVTDEIKYKLPKVNKNIASSTTFIQFNGIGANNRRNQMINNIMPTTTLEYCVNGMSSLVLIKLGKVSDIFTNKTPVPLYRYYQFSVNQYAVKYLGVVDAGNTDIYVAINI